MSITHKAVAILCATGWAVTAYGLFIRPWHLRWGATSEVRRRLPGDELVGTPTVAGTRAITIAAAPERVWPWLIQQGYGRAGWYSYRIDNAWRTSPDYIVPELQHLAVGDVLHLDEKSGFTITIDNEIHLIPISLSVEAPADPASSARIVQVPSGAPDLADRNVVVVADDGPQIFRLRSMTVRGTATAMRERSYRLMPKRVVAWDYGSLRDEPTSADRVRPRTPSFTTDHDDISPFRSPTLDAALSASRVMILATRSGKGTPFAVPLWFVVHQGRIYASTAASSWTVGNVAACPRVAILLGGESRDDTNRLLVRGRARAVPGMPSAAVLARTAWRYYLDPQFAAVELSHMRLWVTRMRYYAQSQPAHVIVTPESVSECSAPA